MPLVTMPGRSRDGKLLLIAGLVDPSESSAGDEKLATKKAEEAGAAGADRVDVDTDNAEEAQALQGSSSLCVSLLDRACS